MLAAGGCARRARPAGEVVTFCLSRYNLQLLAVQAARVRELRERGSVLWLVEGNPFGDAWSTAATDGAGPVRLLSAAGVDAVLLGPEWLAFGPSRVRQLVDGARCYVLGANLQDSTGQPLGHEFMVRRIARSELGLTGLWPDSTGVRVPRGVRFVSADFAARRAGALMRRRADMVGVLVPAADTVPGWGLDFVVGGAATAALSIPSVIGADFVRCELQLVDGMPSGAVKAVPDTARPEPDPTVQAFADRLGAELDSLGAIEVARLGQQVSPAALSRTIARAVVSIGAIDGFLYDSGLVRYATGPGLVSRRNLVNMLAAPGRLALVELNGGQVGKLAAEAGLVLELRPGLPKKLAADRVCTIATTAGMLEHRPDLAARGYRLTDRQLWTIAADALQSPSRK